MGNTHLEKARDQLNVRRKEYLDLLVIFDLEKLEVRRKRLVKSREMQYLRA